MIDPSDLSIRELASRLRQRALSASGLVEAALGNMRLGAYRSVDAGLARQWAAEADAAFAASVDAGPLQGLPISVKDLYGVPGYATFAGSPRQLPSRFERPGPLIRAALSGLAVIVGKTHTVEFAFGGIGTNAHHDTPINPWDATHHRAPGGSSAGAGVSLCEGSAVVALGTDTAGSIRIPASWTGNVGLKTTAGRWPMEGIVPLSPTLDTAGLMARSVEDLVLAFDRFDPIREGVLPIPDPASLRVGRCDELVFDGCSPGVVEQVERALDEMVVAGSSVRAVELPELEPAWQLFRQGGPVAFELLGFLQRELPAWADELDPNVAARIAGARDLSDDEYARRVDWLRDRAASVSARLRDVDAVVWPTVALSPPILTDLASPEAYASLNLLSLRNTAMVSYLGLCAVTLPVGLDAARMPVGLQLVAPGGREARLLAVARSFERILGTSLDRLGRPPRVASRPSSTG